MGLFSQYVYKTKAKVKWWLHAKERGKVKIYFFSKDPTNALPAVPGGYEVIESPKTHIPLLKKKAKKSEKK